MSERPSADHRPRDVRGWAEAIYQAFRSQASQPLALADQAVRDYPDDGNLLQLAAIAALVEQRPERCLRYLKRYGKRYYLDKQHELLRALALAQQGRIPIAYGILKHQHLDRYYSAWQWFPSGPPLQDWFYREFTRITREGGAPRKKA